MQTDRWIEADLFWFQEKPLQSQVREFIARLAPLYQGVQGHRGVILCCGWLCDLVTEWNGSAGQNLPILSPTAGVWSRLSYADLKLLVDALKAEAASAGVPDLLVGVMFVGWGTFNWGEGNYYDMDSGWYKRHPEIYFADNWKNPDFRRRLHADDHAYASLPGGIREGLSFGDFFAEQWKLVSRFLNLDAVLFRDGFLGPCIYEINGPFGLRGPSGMAQAEEWNRELIAFFTASKQANPRCLVMGYSSARSAVAEFGTGCFDLELLVASGALDIWIDQTWAGAWQDWWSQELRGWTFQLANLLVHHAMISGGNARREVPCRHYHLIETFDAWEPWDTLHQVPEKLRWGIWAFTHASVFTGTEISRTSGSYISWAHDRERRLLSPADIGFLVKHLNAAIRNAGQMEEVYGPALAYHRAALVNLLGNQIPRIAGELIDDHAAFLMKWGYPCLGAQRMENLVSRSEGHLLHMPASLPPGILEILRKPESTYVAAARGDCVENSLLEDVGVRATGTLLPVAAHSLEGVASVPDEFPKVSAIHMGPVLEVETGEATAIVGTNKTLVAAKSPLGNKIFWQPPYPYTPGSSVVRQHMYGSMAPFVAIVRAYNQAMQAAGCSFVEEIPYTLPVAFHMWRSAGSVFLLVGNLESGIVGDSRTPRQITVVLRKSQLRLMSGSHLLREVDTGETLFPLGEDNSELRFQIGIASQGSGVYELIAQ